MFGDLSGVVNGKTLVGVLMGVLVGLLLAFTEVSDSIGYIPPELVSTILSAIPAIFILFGVWDSAQDSFDTIKEQLGKFFTSSPALGLVLNIVIQIIDQLPTLDVPDWIQTVGVIIGGTLVVFGLKGASVGARKNLAPATKARHIG